MTARCASGCAPGSLFVAGSATGVWHGCWMGDTKVNLKKVHRLYQEEGLVSGGIGGHEGATRDRSFPIASQCFGLEIALAVSPWQKRASEAPY